MSTHLKDVFGTADDTLTRRRRNSRSRESASPFRVLVIEDDTAIIRLLTRILEKAGMQVLACETGAKAIEAIESKPWELCLLDRQLPDMDGMEICRHIKAQAQFDARRVIMLTGYGSLDDRVEALELGADDYITKPFHPKELLARVNASRRVVEMQQQLVEMTRQLEELSARDGLTGVFNRRHFGNTLDRAFNHSSRYGRPLSVVILDVDRFKSINDSFGHQTGDSVLRELARRFSLSVRASDYVARYGGEEFVILLPETQLDDAMSFGEKLRSAIAAEPFAVAGEHSLPVTISVGTASLTHSDFASSHEMIAAADQALYRAKRNGRNRVEAERRRRARLNVALAAHASIKPTRQLLEQSN